MGKGILLEFYVLVQILEQSKISSTVTNHLSFLAFLIFLCGVVKLDILILKVDTE